MMPDAKKNFAKGMVNQIVVDKYVIDNGITQQAEYQAERARMMKSVDRMLNTKYFTAKFPAKVSDAQVTEFYEKNKDSMHDLLISHGGIKAIGVQFGKEDAAKDFLVQATVQKDITKAAQAAGAKDKLRDFNVVNDQTMGMDPKLREEILSITKFPTTKLIKVDDKTFWVVQAASKEDKKYRPLAQIKPQLKQYIEKEKQAEVVNKEIDKLKENYDIVINEEFFKSQAPQASQGMPAGMQQMMQQQVQTEETKKPEQKVTQTAQPKAAQAA